MSTQSPEINVNIHPYLAEIGLTLTEQALSAEVHGNETTFTADRKLALNPSDPQVINAFKMLISGYSRPDRETYLEPAERYQLLQSTKNLLSAIEESAIKGIRERHSDQGSPASIQRLLSPSELPDEEAQLASIICNTRQSRFAKAVEQARLARQISKEQKILEAAATKRTKGKTPLRRVAAAVSTVSLGPIAAEAVSHTFELSNTVQEVSYTSTELNYVQRILNQAKIPDISAIFRQELPITPTVTAEATRPDVNVRTGPSISASSIGKVADVYGGDKKITISGFVPEGANNWYYDPTTNGFIRNDVLNILPDASGQIPQLPNLQRAYEIARQMKQYNSENSALTEISNLATFNTLIDLLDFNGFPEGTAESLSLLGSSKGDNKQTDVFIQTQTLEENPEKSLFLVQRTQEGITPIFIPYTGVDGVQQILEQLGQPTDVDFRYNQGKIQLINNQTSRVFGYINIDQYLNTFDLAGAIVLGEEVAKAEVNPDNIQGFTEIQPGIQEFLQLMKDTNPNFIADNGYMLNNGTKINGYIGEIVENEKNYMIVIGTVVGKYISRSPETDWTSIFIAIPTPYGGTAMFDIRTPISTSSVFGNYPYITIPDINVFERLLENQRVNSEDIDAEKKAFPHYAAFSEELQGYAVGQTIILAIPTDDPSITPLVRYVREDSPMGNEDSANEQEITYLRSLVGSNLMNNEKIAYRRAGEGLSIPERGQEPMIVTISP